MINRFVLIGGIFAAMMLFADESSQKIVTNEQIAHRMIIEPALQQLFIQIPDSAKLTFVIKETSPGLSGWMKQILVDSCIAHGYTVYEEVAGTPGPFIIVDISQAEILFEYKSSGKKWLFFNRGYKRVANCDFHISVRKGSGRILFSKQISNIFDDTVSNVKKVENDKLSFTKGKKIDSSIAKKLIEPVLITASAVTVVYLFYSLRSGN